MPSSGTEAKSISEQKLKMNFLAADGNNNLQTILSDLCISSSETFSGKHTIQMITRLNHGTENKVARLSRPEQFKKCLDNFFICSQRNYYAEMKFLFTQPQ